MGNYYSIKNRSRPIVQSNHLMLKRNENEMMSAINIYYSSCMFVFNECNESFE